MYTYKVYVAIRKGTSEYVARLEVDLEYQHTNGFTYILRLILTTTHLNEDNWLEV